MNLDAQDAQINLKVKGRYEMRDEQSPDEVEIEYGIKIMICCIRLVDLWDYTGYVVVAICGLRLDFIPIDGRRLRAEQSPHDLEIKYGDKNNVIMH
ncbi:hypothetical protein RND71_030648 [Anisodus tanguticus]|uniref:Uncharacterized protein n=1 Tax=Anisodus tanguticus TaxID=243964 RepID=A0AAE1RFL7_9SOLA|nr:hypothetical protein RND71_030648 [Anisodus tanguticus]